jgi:hypothetical protein
MLHNDDGARSDASAETIDESRPEQAEAIDRDVRSTPWPIVHRVSDLLFGGADASLDLCALESNRKAGRYFGPDHIEEARRDGLTAALTHDDLRSWVWANIPFSDPAPWLLRALEVSERVPVAVLCKLAPSTKAWDAYVWPHAYDIGCFTWRLKFPTHGGAMEKTTLNFDCALVRFLPRGSRRIQAPRWYQLTPR